MSPGRFRYLIMHVLGSRARRSALIGAATVMVGGALATVPAHAAPADGHSKSTGKATATAARADLDVSVADAAKVPVRASLNDVSAPQDAEEKLLSAKVDGANNGQPIRLVEADVAKSRAKAAADRSSGNVKLVGLKAFAPGLPGKPLVSADLLTASAVCAAGEKPVANADLQNVTVLGKPVEINGVGSQQIKVPGLGDVDVAVEQTTTKTDSGAATALKLSYELNPAKLNIVKASGEIVLSEATCQTPAGDGGDGSTGGGGSEPDPQTGGGDGSGGSDDGLAETGGNSATPIIAGVGALLVAGGGAMYLVRRRNARSHG